MPAPGSARDDLPHRRRDLAWLAGLSRCVPPRARDEDLSLALDAYDGHLVLCAQALTRREVSVFFDHVSYVCWDVDPVTAAVSRRADLGRAYFRCQDGACPPGETSEAISYDGTQLLAYDADKLELSILTRPARAPVRSFAFQGDVFLANGLTLVGHTIFAIVGGAIAVLDDRGAARGKLDGIDLQVVDEGHVLALGEGERATLYELASRKATPIRLAAPYVAGAVRHGGAYFAVDGDARKLVALDPRTLQPGRALPLPLCP